MLTPIFLAIPVGRLATSWHQRIRYVADVCTTAFVLYIVDFQNSQLRRPCRVLTAKQVEDWNLKYYNSEVHGASFVLPQFARKIVNI